MPNMLLPIQIQRKNLTISNVTWPGFWSSFCVGVLYISVPVNFDSSLLMKHYKRMEEKLQETFDRAASVRKCAQRVCGSLRSKRFRLVSEQRKTEERDSRFWPREK